MKTIPLTNGSVTMVDDADYRRLAQHRWHLGTSGYVIRIASRGSGSKQYPIFMHREVLGIGLGFKSDHRDRNTLNNQRCNLRVASTRQNSGNRKLNANNRLGFKGVGQTTRKTDPYQAIIFDHGVRKHLGYYSFPEDAGHAYDAAARQVFGDFACVNFPLPGEQGCREASDA